MGDHQNPVVVLISAEAEWRGVLQAIPDAACQPSPYGDWFVHTLPGATGNLQPLVFLHGGWGKIAAAASTAYAIERWQPELIVNLGTCGGFAGQVERGQILLVEETLVYDIIEQMGDPAAALEHYATRLDLGWLPTPLPSAVQRGRLISADRDILPQDIPLLIERFGAIAADWESGAIAWVAARHGIRCLILRTVSDLVGQDGGEAYGNLELFQSQAQGIMRRLVNILERMLS
jgi:adenosylhomocysteine nucleosidase